MVDSNLDTIVAVASPLGAADRAICRLSGTRAVEIARSCFVPADGFPPEDKTYLAVCGEMRLALRKPAGTGGRDGAGQTPDKAGSPVHLSRVPAVLYIMRAPRSYTREDVVEFHLPGWPVVVSALLEHLVREGARPARPGEFTRRAFINGRIDLAQAEAVLGLIRAADEEHLRSALAGIGAATSQRLQEVIDQLDHLAALVELGIDFSEEDLEPIGREELEARLGEVLEALESTAGTPSDIVPTEAVVALVGPPNSGKSSLFNALVGGWRSIVSEEVGTTRDVVTATLEVGRWRLTLADTAGGPGDSGQGDGLSAAAFAAARRQAGAAHLILLVLDRSQPLTGDVRRTFEPLLRGARSVVVLNKADLPPRVTVREVSQWLPGVPMVETSARTGEGLDALRSTLAGAFASARVRVGSEGLLLPVRQVRAIMEARDALLRARDLLRLGDRPELLALELRSARDALRALLGRGLAAASADDLLDRIFSQFCIGK